ncbi:hypothetical protein CLV59_109265 [Chitinophaga dinghuensis]|uniref:DUF5689 domain-containing protein n=1 Tax=Chitinophaga dinghuensis TaxID=1539050 RepID=A0A327VWU1_9BACT|nr:DUF5689 domain-containing protein [Chitinophaga dinghuensis]RAJ75651.1 hypothetical protein CLV59_109265 [Chitinophaga dinghuensis]
MNKLCKQFVRFSGGLVLLGALAIVSCKKTFDEPPYSGGDPVIQITNSIADLQALYKGSPVTITDNMIFSGVVIGDDKSGNLFKQIVIQDSTGGINIQLDASNLNAKYPIGRKVFVKAKGLTLGAYGGLLELGLGVNDQSQPVRIPSAVIDSFLVAGSSGNVVMPLELTADKLSQKYQNMLITLKDMQVATSDMGKTYGDTTKTATSVNINLVNCANATVVLRSSSYANFAGIKVPAGKGNITGIYTFFNTTSQFLIRDTADMRLLTGTRCDGTSATTITISDLRKMYKGTDVVIPANTSIVGTVLSSSANEAAGNVRIAQADNSAGVLLYTAKGSPDYAQGSVLTIDAGGATLTAFNGELELKNVPVANVVVKGNGGVTPRQTDVKTAIANKSIWASTMVTLKGVNIVTGAPSTSGTNYTITDATTGNIVAFVKDANIKINAPLTNATVTGYLSVYLPAGATDTVTQLGLRASSDVTGGDVTNPATNIVLGTSPYLIDFNNIANGLPAGVSVKTTPTSTSIGADPSGTFLWAPAKASWQATGGGFKNYASAGDASLGMGSISTAQDASTNRALGVRQTSAVEPVAFVFEIANTTGKSNLAMNFNLQSLDTSSKRTSVWYVDYAIGDNPTTFTTVSATGTSLVTGGGLYTNNLITVNFGAALDNKNSKVYIRILCTEKTGSAGNRSSTAIDDVKFSFQ